MIADADLRPRIYDLIDAGQLAEAVEEAERLARPADGDYFDLLERAKPGPPVHPGRAGRAAVQFEPL